MVIDTIESKIGHLICPKTSSTYVLEWRGLILGSSVPSLNDCILCRTIGVGRFWTSCYGLRLKFSVPFDFYKIMSKFLTKNPNVLDGVSGAYSPVKGQSLNRNEPILVFPVSSYVDVFRSI